MQRKLISTIMLIGVISISLFFVGCKFDNKNINKSEKKIYGKSKIQDIKDLLKTYPLDYNSDEAIKDGLFVISDNSIVGGEENWNDFISKVGDKKNDSIIVATISDKGDMRLMYLSYLDNKFFSYFDMTRFKDSGIDYYSSDEYKFLKVYDVLGESNIVLVNDESITYEEIENDLANGLVTSCNLITFKNDND